ncbi:unnamed protein product, partial [Prorocentrum cordatum]
DGVKIMKSCSGMEHLQAIVDDGDVACDQCLKFVFEEMPGVMFKAAVETMTSGQMDDLFDNGTVCALAASDVIKEFGKSPKTLQLKGIQVAQRPKVVIVYHSMPTPEWKLKYPTLKIYHQSSMGSQLNHCKDGAKQLFDGQAELLLGAAGNTESSACPSDDGGAFTPNFGFQSSIPAFASVKGRRDSLNEKAAKRYGRTSSGSIDGDKDGGASEDSHDHDGGDGGDRRGRGGAVGSGDAVEVIDDDPGRTGPPPKSAAGALTDKGGKTPNKRPPSASPTPSLAQRSTKTSKPPGADDDMINPRSCGTVDYWAFELRFDRAFNDFRNGRAENQANILHNKVTGIERKHLGFHMELRSKAKKFSPSMCTSETDEDLRHIGSLWKTISDPCSSQEKNKLYLDKFFSATAPWANLADPPNANIDPCNVTLTKAAEDDFEVAELFMEWVFIRSFSERLGSGAAGAENVELFVEQGLAHWDLLPEGAILNEAAAAARATGNQSVIRIAGQAMLTSCGDFWQKKIDWATTHAKAIQEHGGKLQDARAKLLDMSVAAPPTRASGGLMLTIAKEIPYWDARIYDGVSDDLRNTLLEKAVKSCSMLTDVGGAASTAAPGQELQEKPAATLRVFKELFKEMSSVFPADENVEKAAQQIHDKLLDLDLASEHDVVMTALREWGPEIELSRRLRDALHDCRAKELSDDVREPCYKFFQSVVRGAIEDTRFGFMQQTDGAFYDTLETLAPHVPRSLSETRYKVACMMNASGRAMVASKALSEAMEPPAETSPVDANTLERLAKELVRALQKQKQHMKAALLDEIKPNASAAIADKIECAKDLTIQVWASIVEKTTGALHDKLRNLTDTMKATAGLAEFDGKARAAASLDDLLNVYTASGLNQTAFGL